MKLIKAFKKTFKRSYKDADDIPAGDWEVMNKPNESLFGKGGLFTDEDKQTLASGGTVEKANTFYRSAFESTHTHERLLSDIPIRPTMSNDEQNVMHKALIESIDVIHNGELALNPSQQILLEWYQDNRDKVPEWAKWIAGDKSSSVYVYQYKPILHESVADRGESVMNIWVEPSINGNLKRGGDVSVPNWREAILELDKVK